MNAAAWLVCLAQKSDYSYITLSLHDLHWLRMPQQIEFKLVVLVFCCQHSIALPYLARELCHVADMDSRWQLCSASMLLLVMDIPPTHRITIGGSVFWVAAACMWNGLPSDVITSPSLSTFKQQLQPFIWCLTITCVTLFIFLCCEVLSKFFRLYGIIIITSFPKVISEECVTTVMAENALAWIIDTHLEVAHPPVECIKYWATFE